ncbi:MAG: flagellar biosynthesis regulator FlaF [Microgenomates group bacterium]|jgi:flagellar protein FlaF
MSALHSAVRKHYAQPEAPQKTPRSLEYELIAQCTQRLITAWGNRPHQYVGLMSALDANQKMWSTLAVDVAQSSNGLPAKLRAQLFYLYEFTCQHSCAIRERGASVEVLIDINRAVMRGLRGDMGLE